ncbi:DUF6461 domain-containing protein [Planotetraspora sp. A-T 1434]|uniref:DUF6461 domain-containing protein n=1 Tax=Planotetraspora sp. A-T 1434 TaxID=2979219 RepID=UPI0021C17EC0|nr:DUF6461 domain-containing protein [Planotetraspora sp. A-T 1434]MCT9933452.1 DUF6461 domain-containing protein [Planotetraspora sp. A-T 1434]
METYDWFDGSHLGYCFTFVRGLTPEEALRRIGAEPYEEDDDDDEGLITAQRVEGGTLLVEENGFAGTLDEVQRALSVGTVTASVFRNVNHDQTFTHWVDGVEILGFDPQFPSFSRGGSEPDGFLPEMRELGLLTEEDKDAPDTGVHRALVLASRLTGLNVDDFADTDSAVRGVLEHY